MSVYVGGVLTPLKGLQLAYSKPRKQGWREHNNIIIILNADSGGGGPGGVMVKAMDYRIAVREFELQLRYYVHFRTNTLGKDMNPLILPNMG